MNQPRRPMDRDSVAKDRIKTWGFSISVMQAGVTCTSF